MGGALGVAVGPDSVAFFSETKPKEENVLFFLLPMTDRQTDRQDDYCKPPAHGR